MILIQEDTPRWIRELDRFINLKSLLFIHGNVLDLVSFPVQSGERTYWTEGNLDDFFNRYLTSLGYQCVGSFDPIAGLQFANADMRRLHTHIAAGKPVDDFFNPRGQKTIGDEADNNYHQPITATGMADPEPLMKDIAAVLANRDAPSVYVFHFTSQLVSSPDHPTKQEQALFTRILKAVLESREVFKDGQRWQNTIIMICDKLNDLPPFMYVNNPRSRAIHLEKPATTDRVRFIKNRYSSFYGGAQGDLSDDLATNFSLLTEGFTYYEMLSLVGLSQREQLPITDIGMLCERFKYGITESEWDKLDKARLDQSGEFIRNRIKGQESAIIRLLEIIKRAKLGLAAGGSGRHQRPRGVLFFAGPTGVGKTEMAKGLAELLFGDESRLIRFDMSEYASPHADQKLLGAPPGYVGYEAGGKLTNAMKEQPFSVLLFDEIEKAHPAIFDKFLQILDDGRLTDGQGDTVYFSESIIIFTSNLGTVTTSETGERQPLVTPETPYTDVQEIILNAIRDHFNYTLGRPEILNRFGENFVVFDYIRPPADEQIVTRLLTQLRDSLVEQQNIQVRFHKAVFEQLVQLARGNLAHGGRGIRNMVDAALINPLAAALFDNDVSAGTEVMLESITDHGEQAARRFELKLKIGLKTK